MSRRSHRGLPGLSWLQTCGLAVGPSGAPWITPTAVVPGTGSTVHARSARPSPSKISPATRTDPRREALRARRARDLRLSEDRPAISRQAIWATTEDRIAPLGLPLPKILDVASDGEIPHTRRRRSRRPRVPPRMWCASPCVSGRAERVQRWSPAAVRPALEP